MSRRPKTVEAEEPDTFAERFAARHGPFATEAERVIAFVEGYCRLGSGQWAGQPLILRDWQRELVEGIFTPDAAGRRKHRIAFVGMPRKQGKSTLAAALALYALMLDEVGGQVFSVAGDRLQAGIVFSEAKRMAHSHPELAELIRPFQRALENPERGSVYRVLSSDAPRQHGLSPSFTVFDEVWVQPDRGLWDALALGMGAWQQPLLLGITTAGYDRDSLAGQLYEHGRRVTSGEVDDATFYYRWWTAPDNLDWRHPDAWQAANPALDDFLYVDDFEAAIRTTPESEFARFRLNRWTATRNAWLPVGAWDACADARRVVSPTEPVVLAVDGSFSGDSTAIVGCTVERPHLFVVAAWEKPADDPMWRVPIMEVEGTLIAACRAYNAREVPFDPFRWQASMARLEAEGLPIIEFPTTSPARMVPATAAMYDAVMEQRLTHDGDRRLARHVDNTTVKSDHLGPRIVKESKGSPRRIDLAVAATVAYDRARNAPAPPERRSRRMVTY